MRTALVGHSGFVGESLRRQTSFDDLYRSTNIAGIAGKRYDLVVCAGAPAAKWKANLEPEADRRNLAALMEPLGRVETRRLVLISTVDVYPAPLDVDEDSPIVPDSANAYGTNRLELERFCQERFDTLTVRLPALFGPGLRKNAVHDLVHEHQVEKLNPESEFQFYDMSLLWSDLERLMASGLKLVNLATEPLSLGLVARRAFGRELARLEGARAARYRFRTRHGLLWGRTDGFAYPAEEMLSRLVHFAQAEAGRLEAP